MAYKDPEKQRRAKRESARRCRAARIGTRVEPTVPVPLRLETARDVLELVAEEIRNVKADAELKTGERARTVGYLATIMLKAIEAADMAGRVEALERVLLSRPRPARRQDAAAPEAYRV